MTVIKAILLDDEPLALRQMELYAAKTPDFEVVAACPSASKAQAFLDKANTIFTDINMPDLSGMAFVRSLPDPPVIVFTTAYAEYAIDGFRVNAADYLLKPFGLHDFQRAAEKVRSQLELRKLNEPSQIMLRSGGKTVVVKLSDICYIEGMSEYVKVHLAGQQDPLIVLYGLGKLLEQLPSKDFVQVHRSYIIGISHVKEAGPASILMDNGGVIPVSKKNRAELRDIFKA